MLRDTLLSSGARSRLASWDQFVCSRRRRVVHRVSFLLYTIASFIDSLIAELDKFQQNMEARIHEMKTQLSTVKARIENEDPYISLIERLAAQGPDLLETLLGLSTRRNEIHSEKDLKDGVRKSYTSTSLMISANHC
jgi:hypothetical protein